MSEELKPCPFCGSKPSTYRRLDESLWSHAVVEYLTITCTECDCASIIGEEHDRIRTTWNTRAHPHPDVSPDHIPDAGKMVVSSDVSRLVKAARLTLDEAVEHGYGTKDCHLILHNDAYHALEKALAPFTNPSEGGAP